ncbi:GNAT family N-acetyltransferase [Mucilaginibacter sp. UR6-1]|uniref:GNAT family N-acetyltransferase n=1 Tax=Mucilaginibacter sp. UR6-1 TaxID=1435643 RepID=UPI001E3C8F95|nr:GNAT family N-acetyltransferase [Mucilaginibacter sp. UR6-1]MCC8407752.1 GNAT family N-acetyltransferase [Mucilaginibacter sp. UR6-1]
MLQPVCLENKNYIIHPFRSEDMKRYGKLVKEIFHLLSDDDTLHFLPEKRLRSVSEADAWLQGAILNFHCGRNFIHFITDKVTGKLVGMIDIISPEVAMTNYRLDDYPYFIEFYLAGSARGQKIMSTLLPGVVAELQERNITILGAVVNRRNTAAQKVLARTGFRFRAAFDPVQDLYELSVSEMMPFRQAG